MKTKLLLFAALLITTITFSQTSKKVYNHSEASKSQKMNKAELVDAIAKDAGLSKADAGKALNSKISKRAARTGRNPQTGKEIKNIFNSKNPNFEKSDRNPQVKGVNKPKKVAKFKAGKALADTVK